MDIARLQFYEIFSDFLLRLKSGQGRLTMKQIQKESNSENTKKQKEKVIHDLIHLFNIRYF